MGREGGVGRGGGFGAIRAQSESFGRGSEEKTLALGLTRMNLDTHGVAHTLTVTGGGRTREGRGQLSIANLRSRNFEVTVTGPVIYRTEEVNISQAVLQCVCWGGEKVGVTYVCRLNIFSR